MDAKQQVQPKLMTPEELEAWLRAVDMSESGPDAAAALRAHLAALAALPEDVARDRMEVAQRLSDGDTYAVLALNRLATAAARVPGLEADLVNTRANSDERDRCRRKAESERDAARQEAEDFRTALATERATVDHLTARVAELEEALASERVKLSAAEAEVQSLSEQVGNVRCMRQECVRTREAMAAGDARVKTLSARVAALERERDEAMATGAELEQTARTNHAKWTEAEARATAAEATAAELQAEVDRVNNRLADLYAEDAAQPTPAPGLREAVENAALDVFRQLESQGMGVGSSTRSGAEQMLGAIALALPTDATPGPSVTHAQLAAVVEAYAQEQEVKRDDYVRQAQVAPTEGAEESAMASADACVGRAEGAREVQRRVTGGQVPRVLTEARVVEVLEQWRRAGRCAEDVAGAMAFMADLGLTLPMAPVETCPGCPHPPHLGNCHRRNGQSANPCPCLKMTPPTAPGGGVTWCGCEASNVDASGHCEKHGWETSPRVRIAPKSTTEVRAEPDPDACGDCLQPVGEHREGGTAEGCEARAELDDALTQPAPDVVEEREGVQVLSNGAFIVFRTNITEGQVAAILARALAEAKREKRKAAEDMRERAATAAFQALVLAGMAPSSASLIAAVIRHLPVEVGQVTPAPRGS